MDNKTRQPIWEFDRGWSSSAPWGDYCYEVARSIGPQKSSRGFEWGVNPGELILLVEPRPMQWYGLPYPVVAEFSRLEESDYDLSKGVGPFSRPKNHEEDEVLISLGASYRAVESAWLVAKEAFFIKPAKEMGGIKLPNFEFLRKGRNFNHFGAKSPYGWANGDLNHYNLTREHAVIVSGDELVTALRDIGDTESLIKLLEKTKRGHKINLAALS
ncbi:MAG: hypothetical protein WC796_00240 [Candidatus Pacearchaeota archaeon]|jgi:hypothetical protein